MSENESPLISDFGRSVEIKNPDLCVDCGKTVEKPEPTIIPVLFFNLSAQWIEPTLCEPCRRLRVFNQVRYCVRPYQLPIPRPPR